MGAMDAHLTGLRRSDAGVVFQWSDGLRAELRPRQLRLRCPCAACVSETTGRRLLDPALIAGDLMLADMQPVGRYAYRCLFGDGHDTGIYTLEHLRELCEQPPNE
ncbi:MAG: DUF971 domain-containing protein [Planctomycetota bacterium]|nr:MAG: DUF971 domain-containing protein [Planctomycetota bacterium]